MRFLQINLQEEKDLKLSEEINTHVSHDIPAYVYCQKYIPYKTEESFTSARYIIILHVLHVFQIELSILCSPI